MTTEPLDLADFDPTTEITSDFDERLAQLFDGPDDDDTTLAALAIVRSTFPKIPSSSEYTATLDRDAVDRRAAHTLELIKSTVASQPPLPEIPLLTLPVPPSISMPRLSPEQTQSWLVQMAAALTNLDATLHTSADEEPDRLVTVEHVAAVLHLSTDHVYRRAKRFPFYVPPPDGTRAVRFSARGLARYLAEQRARRA
jgi:hypothetical protein